MTGPVLAKALVRWQHAAGPYWPYVCAAPFQVTADAEALAQQAWARTTRPVRRGPSRASPVDLGVPPAPALVLLDLPPEPTIAAASSFVANGWYVVPVVQRWIASPAVLPCRRLMDRLIGGAWQARRPTSPRGAVLIADGERAGRFGYPVTVPGRAFDNRYEYQICRFPSTDFLLAQGVRHVRWYTSGTRPEERPVRPDLAPYQEALLRAGLTVDVRPWPDAPQ